jgi:ribose 1,5-bisphosphokinase
MSESPSIRRDIHPGAIGPGRFILVVGPSGAGKDTLIALAQLACRDNRDIVFPRRVVTRQATAFEDNEQLSLEAFQQARGHGKFAVHWEAHGHCYALRRLVDDDIRANRKVIANVSRTVVDAIRRAYANVVVVLITAAPEILAERLTMRARSSDGKIADRIGRAGDNFSTVADITIANIESADHHARELVEIIRAG